MQNTVLEKLHAHSRDLQRVILGMQQSAKQSTPGNRLHKAGGKSQQKEYGGNSAPCSCRTRIVPVPTSQAGNHIIYGELNRLLKLSTALALPK